MSLNNRQEYSKCQAYGCKYIARYQVAVPARYDIPNVESHGRIHLCTKHRNQYNQLSITQKVLFRIVPHSRGKILAPPITGKDFTHHKSYNHLYQDSMIIPGK